MFYIAGISITLFLTLLLLGKKGRTVADHILACWLLLMGVHISLYYLWSTGLVYEHSYLLGVHFPMPLMHGPFLFLYTQALTGNLPRRMLTRALHFLPPALMYLYLTHFFLKDPSEKIAIVKNDGMGYESFMLVNVVAILISGTVYVILSYLALQRHKKNIHEQFSYEEKINLNWLRYLIYGIGLIWLMVFLGNDEGVFITVVLFVFFIGYFGVKQTVIFSISHPPAKGEELSAAELASAALKVEMFPDSTGNDERKKYNKSGLSAEMAETLHVRLIALMKEEKLYSDPELTLQKLADRMDVHPNYVSQVINEREEKNFYEFVNQMRVEEFIRIASLPENKNFTLLALAMDCGFNSKSSFNKYFRKVTSQSPSEYFQSLEKIPAAV